MALIEISDIVGLLTQRLEDLCRDVLPLGRRQGRDWVDANVSKGGHGDSLKVCLVGGKRGLWTHFSAGGRSGGDPLELIAYVMYGGDKAQAIKFATAFLGLENADRQELSRARVKAQRAAKKREDDSRIEAEKKSKYAHGLWLNAQPRLMATPVDLYLRGRGIALEALVKVPGSLRYAPKLKHSNKNFYPAMVAGIVNADGQFIAVHRTYLEAKAPGVFTKADLGQQAKMVLGGYAGGFIPLTRGGSGKSLRDAPQGDAVILCEGIEDGLTLSLACPEYRVLCAISVGNFRNIRLPAAVSRVVIAADNDAAGSPAARALDDAAQKFHDEGRAVSIARAAGGKDFNDALKAGAA